MLLSSRLRRLLLALSLYLTFCAIAGVFLADGTLHPARRLLTDEDRVTMQKIVHSFDSDIADTSITTSDGITLQAWLLRPHHANNDAVLLLHGVGDNRMGMAGYAQLLLAHGFTVLMPDARAHGTSGGALATYGLLERNDIHQWVDFLYRQDHPNCAFALGESMGAAELLQSFNTRPHVCVVVAESSFANFREIAYDRMGQPFHLGPWVGRTVFRAIVEVAFLRAWWKYRLDMQRVSPEDSVAAATIPVLLIHGQLDSNIPIRHSRRIHARNKNTQLWEVPGTEHCGAMSVAPQEFEQRVLTWFLSHEN